MSAAEKVIQHTQLASPSMTKKRNAEDPMDQKRSPTFFSPPPHYDTINSPRYIKTIRKFLHLFRAKIPSQCHPTKLAHDLHNIVSCLPAAFCTVISRFFTLSCYNIQGLFRSNKQDQINNKK